jgi:hypothetical protein
LQAFEQGLAKAQSESNIKRELLTEWVNKCKEKLPPVEISKPEESSTEQKIAAPVAPVVPQIK